MSGLPHHSEVATRILSLTKGGRVTAVEAINLITGILELSVAGLVLRESARLGLGRPALVWGLAAFFVVDSLVAINRSEAFWSRSDELVKATTLDVLAFAVLLIIVVNARGLAHAAVAVVDLATYRAAEYERARCDYRQIVRHRMMNPLTVIDGAARTLDAENSLDAATRRELIRAIIESAAVLKELSLEPEQRDALEHDLDAVPRI
jgi:hypothetical protein